MFSREERHSEVVFWARGEGESKMSRLHITWYDSKIAPDEAFLNSCSQHLDVLSMAPSLRGLEKGLLRQSEKWHSSGKGTGTEFDITSIPSHLFFLFLILCQLLMKSGFVFLWISMGSLKSWWGKQKVNTTKLTSITHVFFPRSESPVTSSVRQK